jgi:hypothetical protein
MTRWLAELAAVHALLAFTNGRARKLSDPLDRFRRAGWLHRRA